MKYVFIACALFMVLAAVGPAEKTVDQCEATFLQVLEDLESRMEATDERAFSMSYTLAVLADLPGATMNEEQIQMHSGNGRSILRSEHFAVFEDESTRVVIDHRSKAIDLFTRVDQQRGEKGNPWKQLRFQLEEYGAVASCDQELNEGKHLQVEYEILEKEGAATQSMVFVMDKENRTPISVKSTYPKGSRYLRYDQHYHEVKFGELHPDLTLTTAKLLEQEQRIHAKQLAAYELTDHREKDIRP